MRRKQGNTEHFCFHPKKEKKKGRNVRKTGNKIEERERGVCGTKLEHWNTDEWRRKCSDDEEKQRR